MKNYTVVAKDPTNGNKEFTSTLSGLGKGNYTLDYAKAEADLLFGGANVISVTPAPDTLDPTPRNFMNLFVMFGLNYPYDFMDKAFAGNCMLNHLKNKFSSLYASYGANAVMVRFWCELDLENQKTLSEYMVKYYSEIL